MIISGLQKLTLLDYPEKVACTMFTAGCNLRCPFCHNAALVTHIDRSNVLQTEDIMNYLRLRRGVLDGICITGGEPLLHDITDFVRQVRELGLAVKLDTNGCFPDKLRALLDEGLLDYVAMDIKNCPEKYPATVGIPNFDVAPVRDSVSILLGCTIPFEFRTTVARGLHTAEDFPAIGEFIHGAPKYWLQTFKDSGDLIDASTTGYTEEEMKYFLSLVAPFVTNAYLR